MIYNTEKKKLIDITDCITCPYYKGVGCDGLNKICFEYDDTTKVIIDGLTGLPRRVEWHENEQKSN